MIEKRYFWVRRGMVWFFPSQNFFFASWKGKFIQKSVWFSGVIQTWEGKLNLKNIDDDNCSGAVKGGL